MKMLAAGFRLRTILVVAAAVAAVFISGAAHVLETRFHAGAARGEYKSFSALGSGRGEIYTIAFDRWRESSPLHWLMGTGLRSIPRFEQEALGHPLVGHSDIVQVGVELGIVGLIGFLLIWAVLVARAQVKAPLLILGSFSLFNGALEYSAPLVIALLLTVAPSSTKRRGPNEAT
jgi:O-antigen ligase